VDQIIDLSHDNHPHPGIQGQSGDFTAIYDLPLVPIDLRFPNVKRFLRKRL
jgi:hypothetical protein